MKLMTKEIEERLSKYPIGSQGDMGEDAICLCKFFNPFGSGTWLVTEAEKLENDDWNFFGPACMFGEWDWGFFRLSQLEKIKMTAGPIVLGGVERDICCDGTLTVGEMLN